MKPSATECAKARDEGGQARRASVPASRNPYRNGTSERHRLLAEYWDNGHEFGKTVRRR